MSEDGSGAPTPTPAVSGGTPSSPARGPLTIVQGGTMTSQREREIRSAHEDLKSRWAEQDRERAIAAHPLEEGFAAARKTHDLGQPTTSPVVMLQYDTGDGHISYMQADVNAVEIEGKIVPILNLICYRCVQRGVPSADAQMQIRADNRRWHLDERRKGEVFIDEEAGQVYTLAGVVDCPERCRCPNNCGLRFRIAPGGQRPGVSRIVEER